MSVWWRQRKLMAGLIGWRRYVALAIQTELKVLRMRLAASKGGDLRGPSQSGSDGLARSADGVEREMLGGDHTMMDGWLSGLKRLVANQLRGLGRAEGSNPSPSVAKALRCKIGEHDWTCGGHDGVVGWYCKRPGCDCR